MRKNLIRSIVLIGLGLAAALCYASQATVVIPNSTGSVFRTNINNALMAQTTLQSGASAPSITYAYMLWMDTSTTPSVLKIRNPANSAWVEAAKFNAGNTTFTNSLLVPYTGGVSDVVLGSNDLYANNVWSEYHGTGGAAEVSGRSSRGTLETPTSILSGDGLAAFSGWGLVSDIMGINYYEGASVTLQAAENWTSSARGARIRFETTLPGSTTPAEVMRILGNGNVLIGSTTDLSTTLKLQVTGGIAATTRNYGGISSLTPGATVTLNPSLGNGYTLTPAQDCTINAYAGGGAQRITIIITTSGVTSYTITFGTNFKSTGTLATGTVSAKKFTVSFVWDGIEFVETSRTVAM